jgi:hypothetical protein
VKRIFARRLGGHSAARISRELNEDGVPCPSGYDRTRNPHRTGEAWTLRTVAEILANLRYTGRQVWNRQRTDHERRERTAPSTQGRAKKRWNPQTEWIVSRHIAHPPLVSEHDFVAAQKINATQRPAQGTRRRYVFTSLLRCGYCSRRMDAHWVNGRAGYRCRHGRTSANPAQPTTRIPLYVREDHVLASAANQLAHRLGQPTSPDRIADHIRTAGAAIVCTAGSYRLVEPEPTNTG